MERSVDLPDPDGPMMLTNSRRPTSRSTSLRRDDRLFGLGVHL